MKRLLLLAHIRVAAYHDDLGALTRLRIENRISTKAFNAEVHRGRDMRKAGLRCLCPKCKTPESNTSSLGSG